MMNYLALGDSITVGVGAPPNQGYVDILTTYLQSKYPCATSKKIAKKGIKSCELLSLIQKKPSLHHYIPTATLITLLIGGNDLNTAFIKARLQGSPRALYTAVQQFSIQYTKLLTVLRSHSNAPILAATLYNPFPNSPIATNIILLLNQSIVSISKTYRVPVVDLYTAFYGNECQLIDGYKDGKLDGFIPFIQKSPIHPTLYGHQRIAEAFFYTL